MHLGPWCIRDKAGLYRSMSDWTKARGQAVSFDSEADAKAWLHALPAIQGVVSRVPFDAEQEAQERASLGMRPAVPITTNTHEYDPLLPTMGG